MSERSWVYGLLLEADVAICYKPPIIGCENWPHRWSPWKLDGCRIPSLHPGCSLVLAWPLRQASVLVAVTLEPVLDVASPSTSAFLREDALLHPNHRRRQNLDHNLLHVDILGLLRGGWILINDLLHGAVGRLIFLITSRGFLQRRCPSLHQRLRQRSRGAESSKDHVENQHVFEMIEHTSLQRSEWL